jgi:hypothetical protein
VLAALPATAKRTKHVKDKTITAPTARTPTDKADCIALSQAFYGHAKTLARRTKQGIPRGFIGVVTNLDEFCGEEDFDKARISIDWMDTCLENFAKDYDLAFCSRSRSYFCASIRGRTAAWRAGDLFLLREELLPVRKTVGLEEEAEDEKAGATPGRG